MYWFKCKDISLLNKIIQSLYICKPQFTINLIFSFYSQLHRQISNMAVITSLTRHERSIWQVEHCTNVSPFVEGLRPFQISVYSCIHLSLITGSDFFKLSPLHAFGMPLFIFRQMLLDHRNDELLTTTYILS